MSEFEKYIEAKYQNRSPKILFQKFKDIDGTLFYEVKEIEDQAEVWQHQQAKIDDSENTRAVLYRENTDIREKNTDLQAKIELLEKEITETQAFLNNQNHIKQAEVDHFKTMNQRYIGKMQEQQDQIAELKNQLACCREENKALLAVNNSIERECNHISSNTVVVK